jgi:hypothetical protein
MVPKQRWWETWPDIRQRELRSLDIDGIAYSINQASLDQGIFRVDIDYPLDDKLIPLQVVFPASYPFFRPQVFAEPGTFPRHQNPIAGNLCLLGRSTDFWEVDMTVGQLLREQFPKLVQAATTTDPKVRAQLEEHQGEPVTTYYTYEDGSAIFIEHDGRIDPTYSSGVLEISVDPSYLPLVHGALVELRASAGKKLFSLQKQYSRKSKRINGNWLRLKEAPPFNDARAVEKWLIDKRLIGWPKNLVNVNNWWFDIVGLLIEEQIDYNDVADGWMFLVRRKGPNSGGWATSLVRASRWGKDVFQCRIPNLSFLATKKVAIVGLGAIGAPCALELARAGVKQLSVIDSDFVELGTIVRWPFGVPVSGQRKGSVLKQFIEHHYPWTAVLPESVHIGTAMRLGEGENELTVLERAFNGVDMILDTTAEPGIHYFLSEYARSVKLPFVCASGTGGAAGGLVVSFDPRRHVGCWVCLRKAIYEQRIISEPPFEDDGLHQPPGCAERTFTGASFDLCEVSLQATRTVIASLSDKGPSTFQDWDVAVLSMRSDAGGRIPPRWETYSLAPISGCACAK